MNPLRNRKLLAGLLLTVATLASGITPARAETLEIETLPEHFSVPDAVVRSWHFVPDQFQTGAFALRLVVHHPVFGEREWDYMLPTDRVEFRQERWGLLVYEDGQGREFALASDSPFAEPGNLLLRPAGVDIRIVDFYHVQVTIDVTLNPPLGSSRDGMARARFTALHRS